MFEKERKSTRLESDLFISYRLFDKNDRVCEEGMAKTRDISKSGVALENRSDFEVGSRVELTIALSEELVKADAVVRNSKTIGENDYLMGLEFTTLSDEDFDKLRAEFPEIST
jgi:hypothetical protein